MYCPWVKCINSLAWFPKDYKSSHSFHKLLPLHLPTYDGNYDLWSIDRLLIWVYVIPSVSPTFPFLSDPFPNHKCEKSRDRRNEKDRGGDQLFKEPLFRVPLRSNRSRQVWIVHETRIIHESLTITSIVTKIEEGEDYESQYFNGRPVSLEYKIQSFPSVFNTSFRRTPRFIISRYLLSNTNTSRHVLGLYRS